MRGCSGPSRNEEPRLRDNIRERKAGIEKQIQDLVKQSFIGGFITLGLQTTSIGLKKDERVVWETAGVPAQAADVKRSPILGQ